MVVYRRVPPSQQPSYPELRHLQRALRPLRAVVVLSRRQASPRLRLLLSEHRKHAENDWDAGVQSQPHNALHTAVRGSEAIP